MMMPGFGFAYPAVGLLAIFIGMALFYRFYRRARQYEARFQVSSFRIFPQGAKGIWRKWLHRLAPLFYMLGILCLVLAAMRPQKFIDKTSKQANGIDIAIALDVSDSMLIEDMKPLNRLESAKQTLIEFVKNRISDRIAVVIFAGEAFTLIPLTLDYDLIQTRVAEITTAKDARIKDGTALGVALANAAGRLKGSKAPSRVLIFLTDGENNSGTIDPETGLAIAKNIGVKIYSIAIGKSGPTQIPIYQRDIFGNKVKSYQPFYSTVNEELLQKMAQETGGKYFNASSGEGLFQIFQDINRLETTEVKINQYTQVTELFPYFLQWALVFLALYFLILYLVIRRFP